MLYKTFTFHLNHSYFNSCPKVEIVTLSTGASCTYNQRQIDLSGSSYNRFVNLANNGAYKIVILPDTEGVAWQIVRLASNS